MNLDNYAKVYVEDDKYYDDNTRILNWYARRLLEIAPAGDMLELGLGHGFTARLFEKKYPAHTVLEGSQQVISEFKKRNPSCKANIIQTYFENYRPDKLFDVIIMGFVLEHVTDPAALLRQYKSFLKNTGRLYVAVPNGRALNRRIGQAAGLMEDMMALGDHDKAQGHLRMYCLETLCEELRSAGFAILREEGLYLKPLSAEQLNALKLSEAVYNAMLAVGKDFPELSVGMLAEAQKA